MVLIACVCSSNTDKYVATRLFKFYIYIAHLRFIPHFSQIVKTMIIYIVGKVLKVVYFFWDSLCTKWYSSMMHFWISLFCLNALSRYFVMLLYTPIYQLHTLLTSKMSLTYDILGTLKKKICTIIRLIEMFVVTIYRKVML